MTISPLIVIIWYFLILFVKKKFCSYFNGSYAANTLLKPSDILKFSRYILTLMKSNVDNKIVNQYMHITLPD